MRKKTFWVLWGIGLILTFGIDFLIGFLTGFIGHAGFLEMAFIYLSIYFYSDIVKEEVKK